MSTKSICIKCAEPDNIAVLEKKNFWPLLSGSGLLIGAGALFLVNVVTLSHDKVEASSPAVIIFSVSTYFFGLVCAALCLSMLAELIHGAIPWRYCFSMDEEENLHQHALRHEPMLISPLDSSCRFVSVHKDSIDKDVDRSSSTIILDISISSLRRKIRVHHADDACALWNLFLDRQWRLHLVNTTETPKRGEELILPLCYEPWKNASSLESRIEHKFRAKGRDIAYINTDSIKTILHLLSQDPHHTSLPSLLSYQKNEPAAIAGKVS